MTSFLTEDFLISSLFNISSSFDVIHQIVEGEVTLTNKCIVVGVIAVTSTRICFNSSFGSNSMK